MIPAAEPVARADVPSGSPEAEQGHRPVLWGVPDALPLLGPPAAARGADTRRPHSIRRMNRARSFAESRPDPPYVTRWPVITVAYPRCARSVCYHPRGPYMV